MAAAGSALQCKPELCTDPCPLLQAKTTETQEEVSKLKAQVAQLQAALAEAESGRRLLDQAAPAQLAGLVALSTRVGALQRVTA